MDSSLCLLKECPFYFSRNKDSHLCQQYKYILAKDHNGKILKCRECLKGK
jgi:Zn-finger protein